MLGSHLSLLESAGLVTLARTDPDLEYSFRHTLMQEAAYRSLTRRDRQQLHRAIGSALEQLYPEGLEEHAPELANHFLEAAEPDRALDYLMLAGRAAQRVYANPEAVLFYQRALPIASRTQPEAEPNQELLLELCRSLGRCLELLGKFEQADQHYLEMEQLALHLENRPLELAALIARATIHSTPTSIINVDLGRQLSQRALKLAQNLGDRPAEAKIYWNLLLANFFGGNYLESRDAGEQSLAIARELNLREQLAYTLNDMATYLDLSDSPTGNSLTKLSEAQTIWRELGNLPMLSDTLTNLAYSEFVHGETQKALALTDEAYQISNSIGNMWGLSYSRGTAGFIYGNCFIPDKAFAYFEESIHLGNLSGFRAYQTLIYSFESILFTTLGFGEKGYEIAQQAMNSAQQFSPQWLSQALGSLSLWYIQHSQLKEAQKTLEQIPYLEHNEDVFLSSPIVPSANCELYLAQKDYQGLMDYAEHYVKRITQINAGAYLTHAIYYRGLAHLYQNRPKKAQQDLMEAHRIAREKEFYRLIWQTSAALAALEKQTGQLEASRAWLAQAQQAVDFIAEHAGSAELRASFLETADVQSLKTLGNV